MGSRKPKSATKPRPGLSGLNPGAVVGTPDYDGTGLPRFSFEHADREYAGSWAWPVGDDAAILLNFLCETGRMSWAEIHRERFPAGNRRHHEQDIDLVCAEAQARIIELGHDQRFERLYRFGVGRRKRLWGFVTGGVCYVLWWDADHNVYPQGGTDRGARR